MFKPTRRRRLPTASLIACVLCAGVAGSATAGERPETPNYDIQVTIDNGTMEYVIENEVDAVVAGEPKVNRYIWLDNVEVSRHDSDRARAELSFRGNYQNLSCRANVLFDLEFSCHRDDHEVIPLISNIEVDKANCGAIFKLLTGFIVEPIFTAAINYAIPDAIIQGTPIATPLSVCPAISVESDGSFFFDYQPGTDCTHGQRIHRDCVSGAGPGYDFICENGYWEYLRGNCSGNDSVDANGNKR